MTADAEEEAQWETGSGESSSAPGELVARIETGRPVLDWTSLCDRECLRSGLCKCLAQSERRGEEKVLFETSLVIIILFNTVIT